MDVIDLKFALVKYNDDQCAIQPGSIKLFKDKFQFHAADTFDCL